jgi:hypothetical protein
LDHNINIEKFLPDRHKQKSVTTTTHNNATPPHRNNPTPSKPSSSSGGSYVTVPVAPPFVYKTVNQYRGVRPSAADALLITNSALQLIISTPGQKDEGQCSASYLDGYVVTAGHCLAEANGNSTIAIDDASGKQIDTLGKYAFYNQENGPDIGMGLPATPLYHEGIIDRTLLNNAPEAGEVFVSTQFPDGRKYSGFLIYLGGNGNEKTILTDPDNGSKVNSQLCHPGASGSLELSEYSIAVNDTYQFKPNKTDDDQAYGLDLPTSPITYNCGMTVLTADLYIDLVDKIKAE